ncbi:MAG TPA: threonine dehydratase [Gemmatimonadales bacterium]|nr:threonine dehydratase [Gemmatimonadales bacterium]
MINLADLDAAATFVHRFLAPTPQLQWPLLAQATGCDVWVKHENHLPTGAFKVRGGLVYLDWLCQQGAAVAGVITATRGNHGQSIGYAARKVGVPATIVVPHGNSREKNAAMQALGVELIEEGHDFQAAAEHARRMAEERGLHMIRSFHPQLVRGVATYGLELFRAVSDIDTIYVPIGMGSGVCGVIAARNALNQATRVVGVVAEGAAAYALSFRRRELVATDSAETFADGVACRTPDPEALAVMFHGLERVVVIPDPEIREAMRLYFTATHNVAEGAGAIALAALLRERESMKGRRVAVVLTGGNVDREVFVPILGG